MTLLDEIYKSINSIQSKPMPHASERNVQGKLYVVTAIQVSTGKTASSQFHYNTENYTGDYDSFLRELVMNLDIVDSAKLSYVEFSDFDLHRKLDEKYHDANVTFNGAYIRYQLKKEGKSKGTFNQWNHFDDDIRFIIAEVGPWIDPALEQQDIERSADWVFNAQIYADNLQSDLKSLGKLIEKAKTAK